MRFFFIRYHCYRISHLLIDFHQVDQGWLFSLYFQILLDFLALFEILLLQFYFHLFVLLKLVIERGANINLHFKLFLHLLQQLCLLHLGLQFLNRSLRCDLVSIIKLLGLPLSLLKRAFLFLLLFWNESLQPIILEHLFLVL